MSEVYTEAQFWKDFGDFSRAIGSSRNYFEYEEWRVIFRKAREAGLCSIKENGTGEKVLAFRVGGGPFLRGLQNIYDAMRQAKAAGLTARQFHEQYDARVEQIRAAQRKPQELAEERRREAMREATDRRTRRRRYNDTDDSAFEVRVGA